MRLSINVTVQDDDYKNNGSASLFFDSITEEGILHSDNIYAFQSIIESALHNHKKKVEEAEKEGEDKDV